MSVSTRHPQARSSLSENLQYFALLPSANKMSEYLGSIIHNGVVIHKIGEEYAAIRDMEIQTEKEENYKKVTLDKEIKVEDMTFHYPDTEDAVLAHVNVTIPKNKLHLSDRPVPERPRWST